MKLYSEEDKKWLVQEWEKSGKSKWSFAKELGLNYQTFTNWTRKPGSDPDFVEVIKKLGDIAEQPLKTIRRIVAGYGSIRIHLPAGAT